MVLHYVEDAIFTSVAWSLTQSAVVFFSDERCPHAVMPLERDSPNRHASVLFYGVLDYDLASGEADAYLVFDVLTGTNPINLEKANPDKTVAIVSSSKNARTPPDRRSEASIRSTCARRPSGVCSSPEPTAASSSVSGPRFHRK